jgi:periplasmic protein TonB
MQFKEAIKRLTRDQRAVRPMAVAMGLAVLTHLLVAAVIVIAPAWRGVEPPKAISITLVVEPPPTPAEKPSPPPTPAPPSQPYAESGPNKQTRSVPTEEAPRPAPGIASTTSEPPETVPELNPVSPKAAEPLSQRRLPMPEVPQLVPKPLPPSKPAPPKATPKPKPRTMARVAPSGENATTGDPYLNLVAAWILRRRQYPAYFRHQGLVGTASFLMTWARNGEIVWLELIISSGNSAIDLYAEDMIRSSSPLPPMPANRPGPAMTVKVDFPVAP